MYSYLCGISMRKHSMYIPLPQFLPVVHYQPDPPCLIYPRVYDFPHQHPPMKMRNNMRLKQNKSVLK